MKTLIAARRLTLEDLQRVYVSDTPHDPWTAKQVYEQLKRVLAQPKGREYTTPEGVSVITLLQHYQRVAWGGRHFARDSTQQLWKPIRAHLHRQLTMIDIATCAPSVLVWLLGDLCAVECLKYYRDNKEACIRLVCRQEGIQSSRRAKREILIRISYNYHETRREFRPSYPRANGDFLRSLQEEMARAQHQLLKVPSVLELLRSYQGLNPLGAAMARCWQMVEGACMAAVCGYLSSPAGPGATGTVLQGLAEGRRAAVAVMLFDEIGLDRAGRLPATAVRNICQAASDHIRLKMGGLEVTFRLAKESADIMDENGVKRGVLSLPDISAEPRNGRPTAASQPGTPAAACTPSPGSGDADDPRVYVGTPGGETTPRSTQLIPSWGRCARTSWTSTPG